METKADGYGADKGVHMEQKNDGKRVKKMEYGIEKGVHTEQQKNGKKEFKKADFDKTIRRPSGGIGEKSDKVKSPWSNYFSVFSNGKDLEEGEVSPVRCSLQSILESALDKEQRSSAALKDKGKDIMSEEADKTTRGFSPTKSST